MNFYSTLEDCWETVVAAMANQIERLQNENDSKQRLIDRLELQNEDLKIKLEGRGTVHYNCGHVAKPVFDSSKDPFEEVGAGE